MEKFGAFSFKRIIYLHFIKGNRRHRRIKPVNFTEHLSETVLGRIVIRSPTNEPLRCDTHILVEIVNHIDNRLLEWLIQIGNWRLVWKVICDNEFEANWLGLITVVHFNGQFASQLNVVDFALVGSRHTNDRHFAGGTLLEEAAQFVLDSSFILVVRAPIELLINFLHLFYL